MDDDRLVLGFGIGCVVAFAIVLGVFALGLSERSDNTSSWYDERWCTATIERDGELHALLERYRETHHEHPQALSELESEPVTSSAWEVRLALPVQPGPRPAFSDVRAPTRVRFIAERLADCS